MKEEAACNEKITTRKGEVTMKRTLSVVLGAAMVFSLAACGGKGGDPSSETKAQNAEADTANTASADPGLETEITSTDPITIRLAYDVAESHPSHKAFVEKFQNACRTPAMGISLWNFIPIPSWAPWQRIWRPCGSEILKWLH